MPQSPIILHIPHVATVIPPDVRKTFVISEAEMQQELLRLTDAWTDRLFTETLPDAAAIIHPVSRFVVDPERFPDDAQEPMAQHGMGAVYTHTSQHAPLRRTLSSSERQRLMETYYAPHHQALALAVQAALDHDGACLIIDCHSFPSQPLPCDWDQHVPRPDICLGTDAYHTPDWLYLTGAQGFQRVGCNVAKNRPYAGTLVPLAFYVSNPRVLSIMIELNRRLYMDEQTGQSHQGYAAVEQALARILSEIVARFQKEGA